MRLADSTLEALQRSGPAVPYGEAARNIRERLLHALTDALAAPAPGHQLGRPITRTRTVRRAVAHIDECLASGQSLAELPQALNVSQRSLNRAFVETLGMSAQAYIGMARLHAIRRALRAARQGDTVTQVASRFNVWDTGRMAGDYLRLFGVQPSQELRLALSNSRAGATASGPRKQLGADPT